MLDIKAILKANGIEGEVADTISEAIKQDIPKDFVSKAQYSKKVNAIDELNNKIADLEAAATNPDSSKAELERVQAEFEAYKQNIETEKTNASKSSTLREQLKAEGFNEKIINLLTKNFDLDKIEIEEGKIKGWEEMVKPMKEEYGEFISVETQTGNPPANPPSNIGGKTFTMDSLRSMTPQQIKENYAAIQKDLNL